MNKGVNYINAVNILRRGGIAVLPTDTLYGIVGDATNVKTVVRIYRIRRPSGRPFILLLPDPLWLVKLGLLFDRRVVKLLTSIRGLTVVLKRKSRIPLYLTRGYDSLAVRIPRSSFIKSVLVRLGKPVVAPSANPEGKKPAYTVDEALGYFGDKVDIYIDGGKLKGFPSTIVKVDGDTVELLREGVINKRSLKRILENIGLKAVF